MHNMWSRFDWNTPIECGYEAIYIYFVFLFCGFIHSLCFMWFCWAGLFRLCTTSILDLNILDIVYFYYCEIYICLQNYFEEYEDSNFGRYVSHKAYSTNTSPDPLPNTSSLLNWHTIGVTRNEPPKRHGLIPS